jgi:hypothetical protein
MSKIAIACASAATLSFLGTLGFAQESRRSVRVIGRFTTGTISGPPWS